jgi:UDP-glucose 6-dehydrogenase
LLRRRRLHRHGPDAGYSPERINPGDRAHTIDKITKVIAGEDEEVLDRLATIYGSVTSGGVFRAASIKAAEAAKAIENAQRDINIAFMNEVTQISRRSACPSGMCSPRLGPSGTSCRSSQASWADTASALTPIT